jgi:EAL domain-containing protein (putative c-di-GMP-specific phosphodiesterase class I)
LPTKFTAARSAKPSGAPALTAFQPASPATVESLGQQLREVLPARRLHSVSLCDHEANVLWLSEGALGPDEHMLVVEALDVFNADSSLPCHETGLEDGRLGVFLPVRAPTGSLVGVAMILADSKSVGDDTLERMTAAPVRTIMQRLAVLLKPSGVIDGPPELLAADPLDDPGEGPSELELSLVAEAEAVEVAAPAAAPAPAPAPAPMPPSPPALTLAPAPVAPATRTPAPAAATAAPSDDEDDCETIITAAEIASILELELVGDEPSAAAAEPVSKPATEPARPAAQTESAESHAEESGMVRLEFLAEPPVVRPAPNPTAVARKLQAASKIAATQTSRTLRPLGAPAAPAARPVAPAAAATPPPAARAPSAPGASAGPKGLAAAPATPSAAKPAPAAAPRAGTPTYTPMRHPFEPVPLHSRSNATEDDVVVLFETEPPKIPTPVGRGAPPPVKPPPPAKPATSGRAQPAVRMAPPVRTAPAVRNVPPARPAPTPPAAARTPPSSPAPAAPAPAAVVPVASPAPVAAAAPIAAPIPVAAAAPAPGVPVPPVLAPAPIAAAAVTAAAVMEASPPIDLVPFAKLRPGGQTRRFQVQPRERSAPRDSAAADEQAVQQLLAWLGANRASWSSVPTSFTLNLSIATLEDERFLQKVGAALNTHGIGGETLGFEIAESLCAQNRATVERFISQCEKAGTWIAIDDFSFDSQVLPLLRSKALRLLKLDARLTTAALRDKLSQAVVVATVQAAKVLGIHCSAKKAESQASVQYLAAIGLDFAQGPVLSRPVPLDQLGAVANETRTVSALKLDNLE